MASGKFEVLGGYPADVVAVSAHGRIDRAAYEETLMSLVEERIKAEGKVNLLYEIGVSAVSTPLIFRLSSTVLPSGCMSTSSLGSPGRAHSEVMAVGA